MSRARLIACVLLPFAAGYFLSYLFRSINAVIAADLMTELGISAADLGMLTAVYFLVFGAVQLPLGALLDRLGPGFVQSVLMLVAAVGALVFASSSSFAGLVAGRAMIGIGVAVALMAGIKAIVMWFPPERLAFVTGWLVTLGALGALAATGPAELAVQAIGWRGLFMALAGLSALTALLVLLAVPEQTVATTAQRNIAGYSVVYRDPRFWRVAPLAALGVAASWSLQGLWAAPWLHDVEGLERTAIVHHLGVMAAALCAGALLLGAAADWLRRAGVRTESLLLATFGLSMLAQTALVLRWPIPTLVPWTIIAAAGAATVLTYALMGAYFPKSMSGRANGALNLLHVSAAFLLQSGTGFVIAQWPQVEGAYPAEAHRVAMAIPLALQVCAAAWFAMPLRQPGGRRVPPRSASSVMLPSASARALTWRQQAQAIHRRSILWRRTAIASMSLTMVLAVAFVFSGSRSGVEASPAASASAHVGVPAPLWITRQPTFGPSRLHHNMQGD
ncbi:MFS transporter [Hyphomicrobium sp. CS1BSMeth3]|uniref:MFS transporter n=1 Tax=Hyphomicrobium sp. CS1BSMeth3 TaxID=1892844 RepID=UPI000931F800|nr:MFS transporter [Hyphomicrobium sp. CS1BSMeth3]